MSTQTLSAGRAGVGSAVVADDVAPATVNVAGVGVVATAASGGGGGAPTVDGSSVTGIKSGGGALTIAALTTTQANDIIVVVSSVEVISGATPIVASVTGGSLAFAQRSRVSSPIVGGTVTEVWWALAATTLSAVTITVTYSGTYDDAAAIAFGVAGCNTAAPWDSNVSLPNAWATTATTPPTFTGVSTTNANDMLLMALGHSGNTPSYIEASGFTQIGNVQNSGGTAFCWTHASGNRVTTQQSGVAFTGGTSFSSSHAGSVDALTADPPPSGATAQARAAILA